MKFFASYNFKVHILVKQHILRFQIAMHDVFCLQIREGLHHLGRVDSANFHVELAVVVE